MADRQAAEVAALHLPRWRVLPDGQRRSEGGTAMTEHAAIPMLGDHPAVDTKKRSRICRRVLREWLVAVTFLIGTIMLFAGRGDCADRFGVVFRSTEIIGPSPPSYLAIMLGVTGVCGFLVMCIGVEGAGHPFYFAGGLIVAIASGVTIILWWGP